MSDMGAAEEDPCQGEDDLLGALKARLIELGLVFSDSEKSEKTDPR